VQNPENLKSDIDAIWEKYCEGDQPPMPQENKSSRPQEPNEEPPTQAGPTPVEAYMLA
jgi:hypothetical protein